MIEIRELGSNEINEFLARNSFAHLGCSKNDIPYVVPIHYAYEDPFIYIFTTEGKKYEILRQNQNVCLQVENISDEKNWVSVIVDGIAEELASQEDKQHALDLITKNNETLTPAMSIRWMDGWVRENRGVYYRITARHLTGRATVDNSDTRSSFVSRPTSGKVY
jgi:nitroimidazol reductase NimA-like FMN-containing flavoprotein (pyridoxamine 5'-phosphate oxidase superfamily)